MFHSNRPKGSFPIRVEFEKLPNRDGTIVLRVLTRNDSAKPVTLHSIAVMMPDGLDLAVGHHRHLNAKRSVQYPKRKLLPDTLGTMNADPEKDGFLLFIRPSYSKEVRHISEIVLRLVFIGPKIGLLRRRIYARIFRLAAPNTNWVDVGYAAKNTEGTPPQQAVQETG